MTPGDVCAGVFSSCSWELTPASGAPMGQLILLLELGGLKPSLLALSLRVGDSGVGSKHESQRSSHLGRRSAFPAEGPHLGLSSHVEGIPSQHGRSLCAALRPECPGKAGGRGSPSLPTDSNRVVSCRTHHSHHSFCLSIFGES